MPSTSVPLYDKEAEGCAIAALIMEPEHLGEANLNPGDFYVTEYRHLFEVVMELWQRGETINEKSVKREAGSAVPDWVFSQIMSELPRDFDCLRYCRTVRDSSRRRQALKFLEDGNKDIKKPEIDIQEVMDKIRLSLESLDGTGESSRLVRFSNIRILGSQPPSYKMSLLSSRGDSARDVTFESEEISSPSRFKRKIREHLRINPMLPKNYESFIHQLLQQARAEAGPLDATDENAIIFWIREWFKTAVEAEHPDDLAHGYIDRDGSYWFKSERLINHINKQERSKTKLTTAVLWAVISDRGGRRSRLLSIAGKKERCWGLDRGFFEEQEPADMEQLELSGGDEDISWLENGGKDDGK